MKFVLSLVDCLNPSRHLLYTSLKPGPSRAKGCYWRWVLGKGPGTVFTKNNPPDFGLLFLAQFARFSIRTESEVTVHTHSQTNRHLCLCQAASVGFSVGNRKFEASKVPGLDLWPSDDQSVLHAKLRAHVCEIFLCTPRFSAAGMVRMKNREKSGWVHLIWNPGQVLAAGCGETPGRARTFISDQSKEVSQDRERRRKIHRCIQTAIDSARRDWSSARRDWRLFFQTFQPSFAISWLISTNEPSLESLKSQQSDGAIFGPVSPRERTVAPFLRRVLALSAQFPRIRTCSGQINLYRGEIAVYKPFLAVVLLSACHRFRRMVLSLITARFSTHEPKEYEGGN